MLCFVRIASTQEALEPVAGQPVYYWNGDMQVDLILALDELGLEANPGEVIDAANLPNVSPDIVSATLSAERPHFAYLRVGQANSQEELTTKASAILNRTGARGVRAIAYPEAAQARDLSAKRLLTRRLSVKLLPDHDLNLLARRYNLTLVRVIDYSPNTYILEANDSGLLAGVEAANALYEREGVEFATPLMGQYFQRRLTPNDSMYGQQWHLKNTGQVYGGEAGNDINVESVWNTYKGDGINIAIVDGGVDYRHPDIAPNYRTDIDTNLLGTDFPINDAAAPCYERHGTACAGCAAAKGNNSEGVAGAAFNASIVGIRALANDPVPTDEDMADAMNHMVNPVQTANRIHIQSSSWGPADTLATGQFVTFGPLAQAALLNAVNIGRGGKGTIYVWSHGNGFCAGDYGNADGYVSSQYTIAVGATMANGKRAQYSERGAALLINAPSSGYIAGSCGYYDNHFILTTGISCYHQTTSFPFCG
jgi:kexin